MFMCFYFICKAESRSKLFHPQVHSPNATVVRVGSWPEQEPQFSSESATLEAGSCLDCCWRHAFAFAGRWTQGGGARIWTRQSKYGMHVFQANIVNAVPNAQSTLTENGSYWLKLPLALPLEWVRCFGQVKTKQLIQWMGRLCSSLSNPRLALLSSVRAHEQGASGTECGSP